MKNIKNIIEQLSFENEDFEAEALNYDESLYTDPERLENFIQNRNVISTNADLSLLRNELNEFYAKESKITPDEIKTVYLALKNREKHPRGYFDKAGRFYVNDSDLIDVRAPSAKYPYSQMQAARTAKFVKALAHKYRVQSLSELKKVAFSEP
ncbi:MAG: hypothetical protein JXK16_03730 [Thiotrichales bacterium]|nr:hypothetical protein [Thiotrichales bacterium]